MPVFRSLISLDRNVLRNGEPDVFKAPNHHWRRAALKGPAPIQAMQHWYQGHPDFFHKQTDDRPGLDTESSGGRSLV